MVRYEINGFLLSEDLGCAVKEQDELLFSQQEINALRLFVESPSGFVSSVELEMAVWGERVVTNNSLRKLISGLRAKFNDRHLFKNVRGQGYQLNFSIVEILESQQKSKLSRYWVSGIAFFLIIVLLGYVFERLRGAVNTPPKLTIQKIFESKEYIVDYATFDEKTYVTTRSSGSSKVYETTNRQNKILLSAGFSGAFRGIEINADGKTVMHVIEDAKCVIKIFRKPVEDLIDQIACNRQNAYPSFDWIDEHRFYVTFNVSSNSSIKPYIYDLRTKHLEEVIDINFASTNGQKYIDSFIKSFNGGIFSLRQDHLEHVSLVYFKGDTQKVFYTFRGMPYSFALLENALVFVGNNNELLKIELEENPMEQGVKTKLLLAPQTNKIDDPLYLNGNLYMSLGNASRKVIYSVSGNFTHSLENGIHDFSFNDDVLTVLAYTNTGYAIEQLRDNKVTNITYLPSDLNFRQITYYMGRIFLAGSSGIYEVQGNNVVPISTLRTKELIASQNCMLAETESGIYSYMHDSMEFSKVAAQGERSFSGRNGCYFVDKISGNILDSNREFVATPTMGKKLFEHQGNIAHWYIDKEETYIIDIKDGSKIAKAENRVLNKRMVSTNEDILYLGYAEVETAIAKLKFD